MKASAPEHLADVRRRKLISQRDLAEKAGIGPSTVALLEAGRSTPKFVTMRKICDALGIADPSKVIEFHQAINAKDKKPSGPTRPLLSRTTNT